VVFGADHVYRMDPRQMLDEHVRNQSGVTVAGIRVPRQGASAFGIIQTSADGRIDAFLEKPADPPGLPDDPDRCFASMGNYVFSTEVLLDALRVDAGDEGSVHDMGGNIIPMLAVQGQAYVYDFDDNQVPGTTARDHGYWRDVGTLDHYHEAHMDLVSIDPLFSLYNREWPILTSYPQLPGAKIVQGGEAHESIVNSGCIIAGAVVDHAVISPGVQVREGADVARAVLMHGVRVEASAVVHDAILDKNVVVPAGAVIGVDKDADRERGYTVSDNGITAVGKGVQVVP
jgi:glucose-1-phosphate adenylyltransferase